MKPVFTFNDSQRKHLYRGMLEVQSNPYKNYTDFKKDISSQIKSGKVPDEFIKACETVKASRLGHADLAYFFSNCPIDEAIPPFNHSDPVADKYLIKKTFVGEGFLEVIAELTDTPLLAYETRNSGDFFHDVYAIDKYSNTQTQKNRR